jgi:hypothetical protein
MVVAAEAADFAVAAAASILEAAEVGSAAAEGRLFAAVEGRHSAPA